jgi:hypothetical protein
LVIGLPHIAAVSLTASLMFSTKDWSRICHILHSGQSVATNVVRCNESSTEMNSTTS